MILFAFCHVLCRPRRFGKSFAAKMLARSVWEMIKLIASALDKVGGQEGSGDMTWSQEQE